MRWKWDITGRINRFFHAVTDRVYNAIAGGPVGRFFTAYPASDRYMRASGAAALVRPDTHAGAQQAQTVRRSMAEAVDRNSLRHAAYLLVDGICRCSMRTLGVFFLSIGLLLAVVTWLVASVWQQTALDGFRLYSAFAAVLVGVILFFSVRSVGYSLTKSVLLRRLIFGALGLSEDTLKDIPEEGKENYAVAVLLGMALGTASALSPPFTVLLSAVGALGMLMILTTPEAGIALLVLFAPFVGFVPHAALWLGLGAFLVILGYFFKILRGTRTFRMEIQDLVMLLLLVFTLLTAVSAAGKSAVGGTLLAALMIALYFPIVNMISTPHWLSRVRRLMLIAATAAALVGLFQFVFAMVMAAQGAGGISVSAAGRAVRAGFADHGAFAYFMVLAFPFALHVFLRTKAQYRVLAGFACVTIATAVILTFVQSAWIAILVEIVVFVLLYERRSFPYIVIGALLSPAIFFIIPASARARIGAAMRASADISGARTGVAGDLASRILFEKGTGFFGRGIGALHILFGMGYGGLETVCVLYTREPAAQVISTFNFWLYRLLEGGVIGVLLPVVFFVLLLQNCFSLLRHAKDTGGTVAPITWVSLVFGVFAISLYRYSWHDPAALLLFIAAVSLITAGARNRRANESLIFDTPQSASFATIEYRAKEIPAAAPAEATEAPPEENGAPADAAEAQADAGEAPQSEDMPQESAPAGEEVNHESE